MPERGGGGSSGLKDSEGRRAGTASQAETGGGRASWQTDLQAGGPRRACSDNYVMQQKRGDPAGSGKAGGGEGRTPPQPHQGGATAESRREGPAKASRQKRGVNRMRGGVSSLFTASPPTPASAQGHRRAAGPGTQHSGPGGAQSEGT